jgi:hypothetical protein
MGYAIRIGGGQFAFKQKTALQRVFKKVVKIELTKRRPNECF